MVPRFKVGDILDVYIDDPNDYKIHEGIVLVTEYHTPGPIAPKGIYSFKILKGSIGILGYGASFFDDENCIIWLGNINDDPVLKVLYGQK